jgi:hypothetical protein
MLIIMIIFHNKKLVLLEKEKIFELFLVAKRLREPTTVQKLTHEMNLPTY